MRSALILALVAAGIVWFMWPEQQQQRVKHIPVERCISGLYRIVLKWEVHATREDVEMICSNR